MPDEQVSFRSEEWRPVPGLETLYEVSNQGRVRRIGKAARTGKGRGGGARLGLIRKPQQAAGGYLRVELYEGGRAHGRAVHVLVAAAFLGPRPPGKETNHKDGDKQNNKVENLEYVNRSENMIHAYRTGLRVPAELPCGEQHPNSKLTKEQVAEIRRLYVPHVYGTPRLAKEFGVSAKTVWAIVRGDNWRQNNE
jgi:HNH endonuclease/NUMOD4 motif